MTTTPSFATPERGRDYPRTGNWPVLARLPDVTDYLPAAGPQADRRTQKGPLDYRFDPPEQAGGGLRPDRHVDLDASELPSPSAAGSSSHRPPQPHLFQRAGRGDYAARAPRGESPILPRSDPFALPASSLPDTLAPVVRFLVLVALFTAAGTMVLSMGKRNQTPPDEVRRTSTAVRQSLEPVLPSVSAAPSSDEAFAAPSSIGPVGAEGAPEVELPPDVTVTASANASSKLIPQADVTAAHSARQTPETALDSAAPAFDPPLPPMAGAQAGALPQVRISEPPAAVARLPGTIHEIPTRQAKNGDDEPSIY